MGEVTLSPSLDATLSLPATEGDLRPFMNFGVRGESAAADDAGEDGATSTLGAGALPAFKLYFFSKGRGKG